LRIEEANLAFLWVGI